MSTQDGEPVGLPPDFWSVSDSIYSASFPVQSPSLPLTAKQIIGEEHDGTVNTLLHLVEAKALVKDPQLIRETFNTYLQYQTGRRVAGDGFDIYGRRRNSGGDRDYYLVFIDNSSGYLHGLIIQGPRIIGPFLLRSDETGWWTAVLDTPMHHVTNNIAPISVGSFDSTIFRNGAYWERREYDDEDEEYDREDEYEEDEDIESEGESI